MAWEAEAGAASAVCFLYLQEAGQPQQTGSVIWLGAGDGDGRVEGRRRAVLACEEEEDTGADLIPISDKPREWDVAVAPWLGADSAAKCRGL